MADHKGKPPERGSLVGPQAAAIGFCGVLLLATWLQPAPAAQDAHEPNAPPPQERTISVPVSGHEKASLTVPEGTRSITINVTATSTAPAANCPAPQYRGGYHHRRHRRRH